MKNTQSQKTTISLDELKFHGKNSDYFEWFKKIFHSSLITFSFEFIECYPSFPILKLTPDENLPAPLNILTANVITFLSGFLSSDENYTEYFYLTYEGKYFFVTF